MVKIKESVIMVLAKVAVMAKAEPAGSRVAGTRVVNEIADKDSVLVHQAREGDESSFAALVELYQSRAVHIAFSIVGNLEDAKDLAQEAFVKLYERLDRFNGTSRFYTWFYRLLVNTCKDFLRKKKTKGFFSFEILKTREDELDPTEQIVDKSKNASGELLNRELSAHVFKALETLPFQQRTAFSLRYLEGLSLEEIADSMELSVGAVKAHLWQAAQKMQKKLKGYLQIEEGQP